MHFVGRTLQQSDGRIVPVMDTELSLIADQWLAALILCAIECDEGRIPCSVIEQSWAKCHAEYLASKHRTKS